MTDRVMPLHTSLFHTRWPFCGWLRMGTCWIHSSFWVNFVTFQITDRTPSQVRSLTVGNRVQPGIYIVVVSPIKSRKTDFLWHNWTTLLYRSAGFQHLSTLLPFMDNAQRRPGWLCSLADKNYCNFFYYWQFVVKPNYMLNNLHFYLFCYNTKLHKCL